MNPALNMLSASLLLIRLRLLLHYPIRRWRLTISVLALTSLFLYLGTQVFLSTIAEVCAGLRTLIVSTRNGGWDIPPFGIPSSFHTN